jgi:hypothetical protein
MGKLDMKIHIPPFLNEIFGENQTAFEIVIILIFGTGLTTSLFIKFPEMTQSVVWWRSCLAFVLTLDVIAGCVVNFTHGTNTYYSAASYQKRVLFILIHIHLLAIAWLLEINLLTVVIAWGYSIACALMVNSLLGNSLQKFIAAVLLVGGVFFAVITETVPAYFLIIIVLFMLKIQYAFPVDHYGQFAHR